MHIKQLVKIYDRPSTLPMQNNSKTNNIILIHSYNMRRRCRCWCFFFFIYFVIIATPHRSVGIRIPEIIIKTLKLHTVNKNI